jgi:hypothetical protein
MYIENVLCLEDHVFAANFLEYFLCFRVSLERIFMLEGKFVALVGSFDLVGSFGSAIGEEVECFEGLFRIVDILDDTKYRLKVEK